MWKKHGLTGTKVNNTFQSILYRSKHPEKAIRCNVEVCKEWKDGGISQFIKDMGLPPNNESKFLRLDRSQPFCKSNCFWQSSDDTVIPKPVKQTLIDCEKKNVDMDSSLRNEMKVLNNQVFWLSNNIKGLQWTEPKSSKLDLVSIALLVVTLIIVWRF